MFCRIFSWSVAPKELEDIAGNAMNIRAASAAWVAVFAGVDINAWNRLAGCKRKAFDG